MLPKKLSSPLGGCWEKKTKPSQRLEERRIYYLEQEREVPKIFPKTVSPQQHNWGSFKPREQSYSWRSVSRGEFSAELENRLTESKLQLTEVTRIWKGQHHLSILYLGGGLTSYRTQRYISDWGVDFTGIYICQNSLKGTSPVVQWLRACQPTQGTQVRFPVWEDATCHRKTKSGYHNYWPWTLEPPSYNY